MLIVGELINASRGFIKEAIETRDEEAITKIAKDQVKGGADLVDVNAGVFAGREIDYLKWLVEIVQGAADISCCIDSVNPNAIEAALSVHKGAAMINSISLEKQRYDTLLSLVAGTGCKVVALCASDDGIPGTADDKLAIAEKLINGLVKNNVRVEDIYVDPLVQPVATDHTFGKELLKAVEMIHARFEGIHTICGLSNISYGLPDRKSLNRTFVAMAIARGLDAAILDPLDNEMRTAITAAETLAGDDPHCKRYLKAARTSPVSISVGSAASPAEDASRTLTHKERILGALRGETMDMIPYVPRLDLWWLANVTRGTIPEKYEGMMPEDIARAEGWALYQMVSNFADISDPTDILHRAIGLFTLKKMSYDWKFSADVEVKTESKDDMETVEYHTPLGMVRTVSGLTEDMKRGGSSLGWVQERIIKKPEDYKIVGYLFENMEVSPNYERAQARIDSVGDDGVVTIMGPTLGGSPMHMIQKEFLDSTQFYYEYKDNNRLLRELAESVEVYFNKVLEVTADGPGDIVLWGANYDDMITYPPYFEKEIQPWLRKASEKLESKGKLLATHTDGENFGLMDLIRDCGAHVAESVTPYPMTKVTIEEYYHRWRDKMTIMGGIPECILIEETATDAEFDGFLDNLFKSVAPGDRLILGPADSTPPDTVFDRLLRLGERIQSEGRLPLQAGAARPVSTQDLEKAAGRAAKKGPITGRFAKIQQDVIDGDEEVLKAHIRDMLEEGESAQDILNQGMIAAMERIGEEFFSGEVFIPEVLLSARAMNEALKVLEPYFARDGKEESLRFLIGTVVGDVHDIGKNMVSIMFRGVGFEVWDLGISVAAGDFVKAVEEFKPHILGLSALLTTTMPGMKAVIDALTEKGLRDTVKIMVGGAPVNQKYADDIGADGYARDAGQAVQVAKKLVGA
jgi:5-methyltetrahydrofolate--homocysteine methyltransferase